MTCTSQNTDCRPCECTDPVEPHECQCGNITFTDGRYDNASIVVENGCITKIEAGEIPLYTPLVCCTGTGGSTTVVEGIQGERGEKGDSATISIGEVNTLSPGSMATVTNVGSATNAILNFGIPAGSTGASGASPHGVTSDKAGLGIENGCIISLPAQWPPVLYLTTTVDKSNVTFSATMPDANTGISNVTLNLTQFETDIKSYVDTQLNTIATSMQEQISALQTQVSTMQTSIDEIQASITTINAEIEDINTRLQ